ncbi:hypothetical protein GP486_006350 [Trichoglossum hirsutum]|uniref:Uncharacterized protein n=1 Tax=Trichoglossum hirsutum TaxID=265104 RepID=A0A9P8L5N2_9PEZI|nr:hypothetical protein GP486_006350 [Trichoglossum hirsutum]
MVDSAGYMAISATTSAFDIGLKEMCGCTGLFVVNPNGIYFAHYFEDPSFTPRANFAPNVLNFLSTPGGMNGFPSLQDHIGVLNDPNTRTFIITPQKYRGEGSGPSGQKKPQYLNQLNDLKNTIQGLLPLAQNPVEYLYRAPNKRTPHGQSLMTTTSRGRALFEYDPTNVAPTPIMRLYFETIQQLP